MLINPTPYLRYCTQANLAKNPSTQQALRRHFFMASAPEIVVLGAAQDGGVPHIGCSCANCSAAWSGSQPKQYAVSLAILDHASQASWLIDCGPDIKDQYHMLQELAPECK